MTDKIQMRTPLVEIDGDENDEDNGSEKSLVGK